jgi:YHS domain-containing protein
MMTDSFERKKYPRFVTLCGRKFHDTDPAYFPRAQYRGRMIYLCTESCLGAFLADPHVFYKAHRNSEKGKDHVETR